MRETYQYLTDLTYSSFSECIGPQRTLLTMSQGLATGFLSPEPASSTSLDAIIYAIVRPSGSSEQISASVFPGS